jgi:methylmalonyl-CoA/ethylmalonyl-CoA epimerase
VTLPGTVHHVGVACGDIVATREWVNAVFPVSHDSGIIYDPLQDAELCLLQIDGGLAVELVAGSVVAGMLRRRTSFYHLCYEVPDISTAISSVESSGGRLISGPVPAVLFGGREVAFLLTPLGLLELLGAL